MPAETLGKVSIEPAGPPELLTLELIRKYFVPAGKRTLHRWVSSGQFPRPDIALGGKVRYWRIETVRAWINARAAEGMSK